MTCLVRNEDLESSYVIMGNVAYPVPDASRANPKDRYDVTTYRFVARLNIGDVDFVPSREDVKETVHTKQTLAALTDYIFDGFDQALNKALAKVTTPWEESLFKVSWAKSNSAKSKLMLRGDGASIWQYHPGRSRRSCQSQNELHLSTIADTDIPVIIGLSARNVSTNARERIREHVGQARTYVIARTGTTGVGMLEGRPNVYRWADIAEATKAVRTSGGAGPRGPKVETTYKTHTHEYAKYLTAAQLADLADDGAAVLWVHSGCMYQRYSNAMLDGSTYIVEMYSTAQQPRLERFIPSIQPAEVEYHRRKQDAEDALNDEDKQVYAHRNGMKGMFTKLSAKQVKDPVLRQAIELHHVSFSLALVNAIDFGVVVPAPPRSMRVPDFDSRYPLVSKVMHSASTTDMLLYVNARHQHNRNQDVAKATAAALTAVDFSSMLVGAGV